MTYYDLDAAYRAAWALMQTPDRHGHRRSVYLVQRYDRIRVQITKPENGVCMMRLSPKRQGNQ